MSEVQAVILENSSSEDAAAEQEGGRPLGFTAVVAECQSKLSDYLPLLCCSVVCWGAFFLVVFFPLYFFLLRYQFFELDDLK